MLARTRLVFRRSDYATILATIRNGVSDLETLTNQSLRLEPERIAKSDIKSLVHFRDITARLFRGLMQSLTCHGGHDISLNLSHMQLEQEADAGTKSSMTQEFDLRLLLRCWPNATSNIHIPTQDIPYVWEDLCFLSVPANMVAQGLDIAMTTDGSTGATRESQCATMSFNSKASSSTIPRLHQGQAATRTATFGGLFRITLAPASRILKQEQCVSDLCSSIRKWREQEQTDPGLIPYVQPEESKLYVVYRAINNLKEYRDRKSELTLEGVLARVPGAPWLRYGDKVRLAVRIATGVLQLHSSPWLADSLSPADILFLGKQNESCYRELFLRKNLRVPRVPKIFCNKPLHMPQRDLVLLSLGFVLIRLLLGNILEFDDVFCESCRIERQWVAAQSLLRRVRQESHNYFSAVARCLDGELHGLRHRVQGELNFERKVYSGIIAPLKADLEAL